MCGHRGDIYSVCVKVRHCILQFDFFFLSRYIFVPDGNAVKYRPVIHTFIDKNHFGHVNLGSTETHEKISISLGINTESCCLS